MPAYVGEIKMVGFGFAPGDWALCNGQLLPIAQNQALYALLGTMYGGDGVNTFALPDLRGRSPVGIGSGNGLDPVAQGQAGGNQSVTLSPAQMPVHNHVATVTPPAHSGAGSSTTPNGAVPAGGLGEISRELVATYAPDTAVDTAMATYSVAVQNAGGSQPVPIQSPYLGINFIIALTGIYPSQS